MLTLWFPAFVFVGLTFLVATQIWKMVVHSTRGVPPGSLGLPFIGETFQFMAAIRGGQGFYQFVQARRLRYGKCFTTSIFGEIHVFISSTESAKAILKNERGIFNKRYIKSIGELVGRNSLLCASHHHHKLLRTRLLDLFSTDSIESLIQFLDPLIVDSLRTWENAASVLVLDEALKITLKAMCKMLIDMEDGKEVDVLLEEVTHVCKAMLAFPLRLPGTRFYQGLQARKRIMKTLDKLMNEKRRRRRGSMGSRHGDFLQQLLMEEENTIKLTDEEIKDNILTMIIAGQDTTASALTWMVKYLADNQNALQLLRDEQLRIGRETSTKSFLRLEDLNEMTYASKVVKESLRKASVVPWFPRLVLQDCEIEGYKIRRGWTVNIDARSIHLNSSVYKEAEKFNPSRFDDESKPYSFFAFGMGGRTCLGLNMAKAMMLVFLHRLVTTYEWKMVDSDAATDGWALFSRLKNGCPIQVTRIHS